MTVSRLLEQYSASCKIVFEYITQVDYIFIMLKALNLDIYRQFYFSYKSKFCVTQGMIQQ